MWLVWGATFLGHVSDSPRREGLHVRLSLSLVSEKKKSFSFCVSLDSR